MLIINTIIADIFILLIIYIISLFICLYIKSINNHQIKYIEKPTKVKPEDQKNFYLQLMNTSTQEILLFKNKKEFINSIEGYDTIKHFLKGTEEENNKQLVDWYYPGYIIKD